MTQTLAAQLDELMGKNRNIAPGEVAQEPRYDDPDVCKFYLAGYCPHEMFTNTKSDLGTCNKTHDIGLKQLYNASSRFEKMGYEEDFLAFLQKMQGDMDKKIRRHVDRLKLTQGGGDGEDTAEGRIQKKMNEMTEKINEFLAKAEALGAEGKVDESVEAIRVADRYKTEREASRKTLDMMIGMDSEDSKPMEVCMVCGCFLIVGDAPQRIEEHMNGKQHVGFAKVRSTVEELVRRREEKREKERAEREERRKLDETLREGEKKRAEQEKEERDKERSSKDRSSKDKDRASKEPVRDRDRDDRSRDRRDRGDRDRRDGDRRRDDRGGDRRRDDRRDDRRPDRRDDRRDNRDRDRRDRDRGGDRDRDRRDRGDRDRGDRSDRDRRRSRHDRSRSRDREDRKRSRHESPKEEEAEDRLERPLKSTSPERNGENGNPKESSGGGDSGTGSGGEETEAGEKEVKEKTEKVETESPPSPSKEGTTTTASPSEPDSGETLFRRDELATPHSVPPPFL